MTNAISPRPIDKSFADLESVDIRMVRLMRMLLAFSALVVTLVDPSQPDRFVGLTYSFLIAYFLYSGGLYFFALYDRQFVRSNLLLWLDVAWFIILVSLTSGTNSIFFFFFFFPILVASFQQGFMAGIRLTIVSALLFTIIGYVSSPSGAQFELNRFLLRPIYLLILGYMISYWGEREITFKRRLALLQQVSRLSNPRFGIDHTLNSILNKVRDFFNADAVILLTAIKGETKYLWREANLRNIDNAIHAEKTDAATPLLQLPGDLPIHYRARNNSLLTGERIYFGSAAEQSAIPLSSAQALVDILGAESFITVPVRQREIEIGRIYVTSHNNAFADTDIDFLTQIMLQVMPAIENVELLNHMASVVVDQQRKNISRDIHDSTIQPYIGIKLGLEALEIKHAAGQDITKDIEVLLEIAGSSINELRGFIKILRGEPTELRRAVLIEAVQQQAAKFKEYYGINVEIRANDDITLNDRLAAEVFQIVTEGLSNIRRHTNATNAAIIVSCTDDYLDLEIQNELTATQEAAEFVPRSITDRVEALGGTVVVQKSADQTSVVVRIPL